MSRSLMTVIGVVVATVALMAGTLAAGWGPLLGLDLAGGVSVVLEPTEEVPSENIDQAIAIIRQRVDGIGVAEPEITRQGDRVVVALPGTDDQERALQLVGQTAEVRFRPVCATGFNTELISQESGITLDENGDPVFPDDFLDDLEDAGVDDGGEDDGGGGEDDDGEPGDGGSDETDETEPDQSESDGTESDSSESEEGLAGGGEGEFAFGFQATDGVDTDGDGSAEDDGVEDGDVDGGVLTPEDIEAFQNEAGGSSGAPGDCAGATLDPNGEITSPDDDVFEDFVVLPDSDPENPTTYLLGPARTNGEVIRSAESDILDIAANQYQVNLSIGGEQRANLDGLASECFSGGVGCPPQLGGPGRMAVTLDGAVVTAPNVNIASFSSGVVISGNFDKAGADELALILRFGSLPVELEPITQQTISATIGEDALRAGLIAGAVGLGLVAIYVIFFYRLLGVVAMASLAISSALLWIIVAFLGENQGLALTLAGITGIIVSFGVSLDSNVVVFENLKESIRNGKSVRSVVDQSFSNAYSTIIKADVASLIGAVLLYFLTIGSVRGFALFLGIATVLDLVVTGLFLRPAVTYLANTEMAAKNPASIGVPEPGSGDLGTVSS